MFRRGLLLLAITCVPALAACSLLLGEGFTDPNADPALNDSGTSADSAGLEDRDGGTTPSVDARPDEDSTTPGLDGGKLVCPPGDASFCDDFERDDVKGAWDYTDVKGGGTLAIVKGNGTTRRLESAVPAVNGSAQMGKDFTLTPKKIHIELALEIVSLPSTADVYMTGVMMFSGSGSPTLLYLFATPSGVFFVEQITDGVNYMATALPLTLGAKQRVVIDVTFGGKAVVTVDGATKIDKNAETWLVPKPPRAILGGGSITGAGLTMRVDDYVFSAE